MLLLAYVVLIAAFGCLGLLKAKQIKKRPREIREMMRALALLDTEIFWGATPLPAAFAVIKDRTDSPWKEFFAKLEEQVKRGESASHSWEKNVVELRRMTCLEEEEWKVIKDLGKELGRSDRSEQHKHLELVQKHLAALWERARAQADSKAKMWSYLGFLGGAAMVIFII